MTLCLEKARRAWVRLPRPIHAAMLELREMHPRPTPFSTSQCVRFEPKLEAWGLTAFMQIPDPHNPGTTIRADKLNGLGYAFAKHLPPLSTDKRTLPPLMPLADILADLPQGVFDWITTTPIKKLSGGVFFEVLGVLLPDVEGVIYRPSRELALALDELKQRRSGVVYRSDGPAHPLVSPALAAALTVCAQGRGVPWKNADFDGRVLRPLLDSDGAGLISLRHMPVDPAVRGGDEEARWVVPHSMRQIAKAIADGHTDPFYLLTRCPDSYSRWVANGCPIDSVPQHPKLLALIGVIRKKGKYDWQLTPVGKDIQPRLAAHVRAYIAGTGAVADDSHGDGEGVDIVLPEPEGFFDPAPDGQLWDILGDAPDIEIMPRADIARAADQIARVAATVQGIIEAPTPPFTKDGDGYHIGGVVKNTSSLVGEGFDISATDDEFDIL